MSQKIKVVIHLEIIQEIVEIRVMKTDRVTVTGTDQTLVKEVVRLTILDIIGVDQLMEFHLELPLMIGKSLVAVI